MDLTRYMLDYYNASIPPDDVVAAPVVAMAARSSFVPDVDDGGVDDQADDGNIATPGDPELDAAAVPAVAASTFNPSDHTVADVIAYVDEHPDEREQILAAEQAGKARSTLIDALTPDDGAA